VRRERIIIPGARQNDGGISPWEGRRSPSAGNENPLVPVGASTSHRPIGDPGAGVCLESCWAQLPPAASRPRHERGDNHWRDHSRRKRPFRQVGGRPARLAARGGKEDRPIRPASVAPSRGNQPLAIKLVPGSWDCWRVLRIAYEGEREPIGPSGSLIGDCEAQDCRLRACVGWWLRWCYRKGSRDSSPEPRAASARRVGPTWLTFRLSAPFL